MEKTMHTAILGTQWGDEGKGKIIDLVAKNHDIIVRCQGGNNAGHTVVVNNEKFPFHLLPSAVLYPDKICVLGNGMVIDPNVLSEEINTLKRRTNSSYAQLFISDRAHLITPEHIKIDQEQGKSIGTTGRGIGPSYSHKISRKGMRFHQINNSTEFSAEVKSNLTPLITDTGILLDNALKENKRILFEGAQATMLDIDHGSYPFVTSSNCTVGGLFTGSGIFPKDLTVVGVAKAYSTRVGNGPFVTELFDDTGNMIRTVGNEYGTTTGRPRRCGWFDVVVLRYSARINNLDCLALTKLDVLTGLKEIKICTGYKNEKTGEVITNIPADVEKLNGLVPEYITLDGWTENIFSCKNFEDLPENTKIYVNKIEELTDTKVKYIGVGPGRDDIIIR